MSNETIRNLLIKLQAEIGDGAVDDDTRALLRTLESDIHDWLDSPPEQGPAESLVGNATKLETSFAASHPVAERVLREIIDTLSKMGV